MVCLYKLPKATLLVITLYPILTIDKINSKSHFPQVSLTGKAMRHCIPTNKQTNKHGDGAFSLSFAHRAGCWGGSVGGLVSSASTEVIPLLLVTSPGPCLHRILCWNNYCIYIHTLSHSRITSSHWRALRSTRKSIRLWLHLALGWSLTR